MPQEAPLGRLLLEDALPEDVRPSLGTLDSKGIRRLFQDLAERHPDKYREVAKKLSEVAVHSAYESGGYSFGPEHLRGGPELEAVRRSLKEKVRGILLAGHDPKRRDAELVKAALEHMTPLTETAMREALAAKNPLALQVASGSKGKAENLKSLLAGDTLYNDPDYKPVPYPVLSSFYEGLRPHEFFGGTFGARQAISLTKLGTAKGGYLAKRLAGAAHRLVVTAPDGMDPHPDDPPRGLPGELSDPDVEGALLAAPLEGYPRNTVLTREVLSDLKKRGLTKALVRSPIVGGPRDGGVYGRDVGVRERGRVAPVGDYTGLNAAAAISEPATQTIIGCLVKGTLVRMADGSDRPIETIAPGETVLGVDPNPDGTPQYRPVAVLARFDNGVRRSYRFRFDTSYYYGKKAGHPKSYFLECTPDHKVLSDSLEFDNGIKIRPVGCSHIDFMLVAAFDLGFTTTGSLQQVSWGSRQDDPEDLGEQPTYDIEVDHPSGLFVLANGLVVSNSKHGGGVAGSTKAQEGFPVIDRLASIPANFQGGATHAEVDGLVTSVADAPQGGKFVTIEGVEHYVPPEQAASVSTGDRVEAGDPLSDGVLNPAKVVEHKGVGEGRRLFTEAFMKAAQAAGFRPHRRNVELIARGLIDHVELTQEVGDHAPGDVVPYHTLEHDYEPRPGHKVLGPKEAAGHYLERPALWYSVGTRVTPSVQRAMEEYGVKAVAAHPEPPPFVPRMIRSHDTLIHDPDPLTRQLGSNLEKGLLKAVHRADVSDTAGSSYVPALAAGVDFGSKGLTQGFKVEPPGR